MSAHHEVHSRHFSTRLAQQDESRDGVDVELYGKFLGLIRVDLCHGHFVLFFVGFDEGLDELAGRGPAG